MRKLLLAGMGVLVLAAGWAGWLVLAPFGPVAETFVVVPPHSSAAQVAELLQQHGIVRSEAAFVAWRLWRRGTLKAGEYRFDHPAKLAEVYGRLLRGDVYTLTVTVPEGYNVWETAQAFEAARLKPAEEFVAGAHANVDLIADLAPQATTLEGYLFPDTYKFAPVMTVREMQAAMVKRFRLKAQALGIAGGRTAEVVTLASLVEKETGAAGERGLVASVFRNRLARGMPLATDPAVIYGLLLQGRYRGTIYASDLKGDTAYNTYLHAGLPPGPICSPGVASLRAAAAPPATEYLYFVSDNAGHSRFATTLAEHDRNVAAYRRSVRGGGR